MRSERSANNGGRLVLREPKGISEEFEGSVEAISGGGEILANEIPGRILETEENRGIFERSSERGKKENLFKRKSRVVSKRIKRN